MSNDVAVETAYAKINLALHVRRRRADGYHDIETLFAFCADGDRLSAAPAGDLRLEIEGPFAAGLSAGADNLVLRAAEALREAAGVTAGARLVLDKRLPVASGIGGGSADAAAALRLLARLWRVDLPDADMHAIAAALGADVPACLVSRACRGDGRGDALAMLDESGL
ncbi:MAG TPA: 4-(cytidine 5'-diphospho)-2-C-methyl-D-erythritol kinase, partial [Sphingomonas sp.]